MQYQNFLSTKFWYRKFDDSTSIHQIHQTFPPSKFCAIAMVYSYVASYIDKLYSQYLHAQLYIIICKLSSVDYLFLRSVELIRHTHVLLLVSLFQDTPVLVVEVGD